MEFSTLLEKPNPVSHLSTSHIQYVIIFIHVSYLVVKQVTETFIWIMPIGNVLISKGHLSSFESDKAIEKAKLYINRFWFYQVA